MVDDLVLNTPWGAASNWSQRTLTSVFHNEVIGGDRFFDIMEQMQRELSRHAEVVELMYLCTSLGFEGRYRVVQRGTAALTELRDSVYRAIRTRHGELERELSPHWQGIPAAHRSLAQRIPAWAIGLTTLAVACVIYVGFNFALAGSSDIAFADLSGLPPKGPVQPIRALPAPPPPAPLAAVTENHAVAKLHQFLAPEIKAGLVVVLEDAQSVTVRLTSAMFPSGSAELGSAYTSLLHRIGDALQSEHGKIAVNGYTDNQPIRTIRFPSNFQLSEARAAAVAGLIRTRLSDPARVSAQGKGEADPIAANATAAGPAAEPPDRDRAVPHWGGTLMRPLLSLPVGAHAVRYRSAVGADLVFRTAARPRRGPSARQRNGAPDRHRPVRGALAGHQPDRWS